MPAALLEFSRGVMWQRFSSVFTRPICALVFGREMDITPDLAIKLKVRTS